MSDDTGAIDAEDNAVQSVDSLADSNRGEGDSAHLQPVVAPSQEHPAAAPLVADEQRDTMGRVGRGNTLARRHGRYSRQLQEDAAPWRAEQVTSIKADLGDDVSTLKLHTIEQLGNVLVILRFLGGNLMAEGPLTGKGRQRAATTAYLATLDRFMRLTQALGLERTAKQVPNPVDWLEGKA